MWNHIVEIEDHERSTHTLNGWGDASLGASVVLWQNRRADWGALYASAFYRENGEGSFDYEYGDAFFANAAVEAPLGHLLGQPGWDWLTPGLELAFRYAGYDHADGERYQDSGGAILYVAPWPGASSSGSDRACLCTAIQRVVYGASWPAACRRT